MLVHNPTAGDEEHDAETLCAIVAAHGHDVVYRSVKEDGWTTALAQRPDLVVAAGGDGTVCEVFIAVAGTDVTATVLPLGSANNIAGTLGLADREVSALIRGWSEGQRRGFDLGEVSGRTRFVESFGGGVFARLIAGAHDDAGGDDKVDHGLHLLRRTVAETPSSHWELGVDGVDLSGDYVAVEFMNVREIGPNVLLAPEADPADLLLDLVRMRAEDAPALLDYIDARLEGGDPEPPRLAVERILQATLRPPAGARLHVDDELWSPEGEGVDIRLRQDVTVFVPAPSLESAA
jgi:diacylglycerol kinase family enzyme